MTETKQRRHLKRCARFKARRVKLVGIKLFDDATVERSHTFNRNQAKRFLKRHPTVDVDGRRFE